MSDLVVEEMQIELLVRGKEGLMLLFCDRFSAVLAEVETIDWFKSLSSRGNETMTANRCFPRVRRLKHRVMDSLHKRITTHKDVMF